MTRPGPHASYREHVSSKAEAVEEKMVECSGGEAFNDLVERLKGNLCHDNCGCPDYANSTCIQELCATEIESLRAQLATARKTLQSISTQCGNVIYNCEQRPADNKRHLDSCRSIKEFVDAALNSGEQKQSNPDLNHPGSGPPVYGKQCPDKVGRP